MGLKSKKLLLTNRSGAFRIVFGTVIALIISFVLTMGMTSYMLNSALNESWLAISASIIRFISVLVGVIVATSLAGEKLFFTSGIISIIYLLFLIGFGIVIFNGSFYGFGFCLISVLLGGSVGFLIRLKLQNKHQRKIKLHL